MCFLSAGVHLVFEKNEAKILSQRNQFQHDDLNVVG